MMAKLNFIWKERTGKYASGESLYVNRIRVGGWDYNIARMRDDKTNQYQGAVNLPSLTEELKTTYGSNTDEIKVWVEKVVTDWFNEFIKEV